MKITFHRAFDQVVDPVKSLVDLITLKFDRVLTSGTKSSAIEGSDLIRALIKGTEGRLIVMPGGGVNEKNISQLVSKTGATEFHLSAKEVSASKMKYRNEKILFSDLSTISVYEHWKVNSEKIKRMRNLLDNL
jgi:copper homeostasis protein